MTKRVVPAIALCLMVTGCGWFASKPEPAPAPQPVAAPAPAPQPEPAPVPLTHTVKKGESLGLIAKKYSVPAKKLMEDNKIANAKYLKAGTELTIPGKTVAGQVKPVAEKAPAKAAATPAPPPARPSARQPRCACWASASRNWASAWPATGACPKSC